MAVTIRDVAKRAGTSTAAVSAVLSGSSRTNIRVGEVTRARIIAAARELGFRPNPLARGLVTGKTRVFGAVFPYLSTLIYQNPFCMKVLAGVTEEVIRQRYNLMFHTALGDDWTRTDPNAFLDRRVEGLLLFAPPVGSPLIERCRETGFPAVALVHTTDPEELCTVNVEDSEGGKLAAEHLLALGHRRLAHFTGNADIASSEPRRRGFLETVESAGVETRPEWIIEAGFDWKDGYRAAAALFALPREQRPTAVFAANDLCASGLLRYTREQGIRVPEDLAVVGFDDTWFAEQTDPPLTSVHAPLYTMGILAAGLLINQVEGKEIQNRHPTLPVTLSVRASTAGSTEAAS